MREDLIPPFKFDLRTLIIQARRKINSRVDGVSINIPFLSFRVAPTDLEKRVAREILIRVANKRVLSARECCDNCIDGALASLQEIRAFLLDKQVDLSNMPDSPLYMLIEFQLEAIRQFLTFEQRVKDTTGTVILPKHPDFHRAHESRQTYFAALEMLRAHLHRCLLQVAKIGKTTIPKFEENMRYEEAWMLDAYEKPLEVGLETPKGGRSEALK